MPPFKDYFRAMYLTFGYPLTKRSGTPLEDIVSAEKSLGVRVPMALREYYLVAGRVKGFNTCNHRLLSPADWELDNKRLIFMEENQKVLLVGCLDEESQGS